MKRIKLFEEFLLNRINEAEDSHSDYPQAAKKNAQKAIDWKEKYGREEVEAGTAVGWARAHQLANGENISSDTVKRMSSFNRHRKNATIAPEFKETPWLDKGFVSWLIWGGDAGVDWAMARSKEIDTLEEGIIEEKKKSKPKSDKQKIKDLTKKQKSLSSKSKDFKEEAAELAKDKDKDPTDKIKSLLLKSKIQQVSADGMKAAVQKQQIGLKSKLKTVKKKQKATK